MFEANGWTKFAEEDIYNDGCQPDSTILFDGQDRFIADTIEELIKELAGFVDCEDEESILRNSCDEDGRLDIQIMESAESCPASPNDIKRWKEGEMRLWRACYTFRIEDVTRKAITL